MGQFDHLCGWKPTPKDTFEKYMMSLPIPYFSDIHQTFKGYGKNKTVLLYDCVRKVYGKDIAQVQQIGDCVSFSYAHGSDYLQCAEICAGDFEEFTELTATEYLYGAGRVLIGGGQLGNSDGAFGEWMRRAIMQHGVITRKKYDKDDLTIYSGQKAKSWGYYGPPSYLVDIGRKFPIKTTSLVRTWEEARDSIAAGFPLCICSNRGFTSIRDKEGFASRSGSWSHALTAIGVKDDERPGVCILNSWGKYMSGPRGLDAPEEAFWCDAEVLERDMLSVGDSFSISDKTGFVPKKLSLRVV